MPVGGGGLAAGIAVALRAVRPEKISVVGVVGSRRAAGGGAFTIADGIAVKRPR